MPNRLGPIPYARPNWSSPVEVEYSYRTSILSAQEGGEQREALRRKPRTKIGYRTLISGNKVPGFVSDMAVRQDDLFSVRAPGRAVRVTAAIGADLAVDAVPFWLAAGQAVILSDGQTEETAKVASVSGSTVSLTAPPAVSANVVYCAHRARAAQGSRLTARTDRVWAGSMGFLVDPGEDLALYSAVDLSTFEGLDLFDAAPNWLSAPEITFGSERRTFDVGYGPLETDNPVPFPHETVQLGYTALSADAAESFAAFFHRQRGKRGAFRGPTFRADMIAAAPAEAGSTLVIVSGEDILSAYPNHPVYRVLYASGAAIRVTGMSPDGAGNTILALAEPWPRRVAAGQAVSWCPIWRFASDRLEVRWRTDEIADMTFAWRTLPEGSDVL